MLILGLKGLIMLLSSAVFLSCSSELSFLFAGDHTPYSKMAEYIIDASF